MWKVQMYSLLVKQRKRRQSFHIEIICSYEQASAAELSQRGSFSPHENKCLAL